MVTIREKLKKSKIIFKLWTKYHNCKLKKVNERKTKGKYDFHKEFLWNNVFERIERFMPANFDVCIVSPRTS